MPAIWPDHSQDRFPAQFCRSVGMERKVLHSGLSRENLSSCRGKSDEAARPQARGAPGVQDVSAVRPSLRRGHREGRASTDAHGPRAKSKARGGYHRISRPSGLPCAMGLRLIRDLPGAPGCLATVAHDACASARDTSIGVSGPRDFAVRLSSFVRMRDARCDENRPSHPTQRFVTFAKAPLDRAGWGNKIMNSEKKKQEYCPRRDWTGQIA